MLVQRSSPLLLVPGGVVVGHGGTCLFGALVGDSPPLWQAGLIGPLLCLSMAAAAMVCARSGVVGTVGTKLRERHQALDPSPQRAQVPVAVRPPRLAPILGFESLCRRGPPTALA